MNETTTILDVYKQISAAGVPGLLALFIYLLAKRVLVWGYQLVEVKAERDEYKSMVYRTIGTTDKALNVASQSNGASK